MSTSIISVLLFRSYCIHVAVPVVIAVLIGQYLDEKYNHSSLFTILGFVFSALISGKIIHKKAKMYGKAYQKLVDNENIKKEKK